MKKRTSPHIARTALVLCVVLVAAPLSARGFGAMNYSKPVGINLKAQTYRDGVYTGTADAYRPGLTVAVSVQNGKVTSVKVTEHHEDGRRFYDFPIQVIPPAIVKAQNTKVDAVSGATATSYGIMAAVEKALAGAK